MGLVLGLLAVVAGLAALLVWGDHDTHHAASILGIALGCALAAWLISLLGYLAWRGRR